MKCQNCKKEILLKTTYKNFCDNNCYSRFYYKNNKDKVLNINRKYRLKYPERVKESNERRWKKIKNNPEKLKKYNKNKMEIYRKKNPTVKNNGWGNGWEKVRIKALERDNYICQNCGIEATEVHHKDGTGSNKSWKERNNKLSNLISVCHKCNINLDLELWGTPTFNKGKWQRDIKRDNMILELANKFSQSEISRKLGITRQRVSQIIKREGVSK